MKTEVRAGGQAGRARTRRVVLLGALALAMLAGWWQTAPPAALEIAGPVVLAPTSPRLARVELSGEVFGSAVQRTAADLPGYDDVVVLADGTALASGMDGWIWRIDLAKGRAERWLDAPLMPAGLRVAPDDPDIVYFCSAILHGQSYPAGERVGLYALKVSTGETHPIVLDVPLDTGGSGEPQVFTRRSPAPVSGTRPLAFCNDLDVSADGQRLYFSEPFAYEGASMGGGAFAEAIALGRNGRLWAHDRQTGTTHLVARGFHFLDGVLIEPGPGGGNETSVLVTETTRYRIQRLFVDGADAGRNEILWNDLPGMPDGLDRDADGNIWVGLLALRAATTDWVHAHPWIKPLLLRLPRVWIPKGEATGVLALGPRGERALLLALHDGSAIRDISVAIPSDDRIYLASFDPTQRGLAWISRSRFESELASRSTR